MTYGRALRLFFVTLRMVIAELDRDLFTLCLTIKRKSYEKVSKYDAVVYSYVFNVLCVFKR